MTIDGQNVSVKGPKGTLDLAVAEPITVARDDDGAIVVTRPDDERRNRSLHGLSRTLVANLVTGVTDGYTIKMEIFGVGYRVVAKGSNLEFALGYSHPVLITAPEGVTFAVETPTKFSISGIDKQKVGQIAANIRRLRKSDPYKGKGIRYEGEQIRRKVGKTGKSNGSSRRNSAKKSAGQSVAATRRTSRLRRQRGCARRSRARLTGRAWWSTGPLGTSTCSWSTT